MSKGSAILPVAALGLGLVASILLSGVVMGDTHVPVAIEPDAPHPAGTAVATFALG